MLRVKDLSLEQRLQNISLTFDAGHFVHLLGPNGAGKSSLLSVIAGLESQDAGAIDLNGRSLSAFGLEQLASQRCYLQQQQTTPFDLTVSETLRFFAHRDQVPQDVDEALEVSAFMTRKLATLSGGEQRRVHIARVLMQVWPYMADGVALILLDEPTQGLDFRHQHQLFTLLRRITERGHLVLCSHHDLNLTHQYASQLCLLNNGQLVAKGAPSEVMRSSQLEQVFACRVADAASPHLGRIFQTYLD